jgi:hypothetical protein
LIFKGLKVCNPLKPTQTYYNCLLPPKINKINCISNCFSKMKHNRLIRYIELPLNHCAINCSTDNNPLHRLSKSIHFVIVLTILYRKLTYFRYYDKILLIMLLSLIEENDARL